VGDVRTSAFPQIEMRKGIELEMVINGMPGTLRPAKRGRRISFFQLIGLAIQREAAAVGDPAYIATH
jgi:hypothetical protein